MEFDDLIESAHRLAIEKLVSEQPEKNKRNERYIILFIIFLLSLLKGIV